MQRAIEDIERRAIGADLLSVVAHVQKNVRMVKWRVRAHAHELFHADFDAVVARAVLEMGCFATSHHCAPDIIDLFGTLSPET